MLSRCALARITSNHGRLVFPSFTIASGRTACETLGRVSIPISIARSFSLTHIRFGEVFVVKTPAFAESVTSGDIRWTKEVGDTVAADEAIAEIETDKTSIPINSPVNGVVKSIMVEDGESVEAHQEVAQIEEGGGSAPAATSEKPQPAIHEQPKVIPEVKVEPVQPVKPVTSEIPKQAPPVPPMPTTPLSTTPVSEVKPIKAASKDSSDLVGGFSRAETRVKMNRMRMKIAKRLKEAQNTAAMLTTFNEIDMSNAIELRNQHKEKFEEKHNLKLTFMSAFVKASVYALQDSPIVNAVIDDNSNEIVYRDYIDVSVAVATPKGLVVPVLRNCNQMNYVDIERGLSKLAEKARNSQLAIEDMDGGTFTVSNGGVFGSLFGTPILNPPQSAILGMHAINERAVVVNGKIEIRPIMFVALTYDHRLLDGREAVLFLRKIKTAIEDPRMMLLDL